MNQLYKNLYPLFFGFPSHLCHHRALSKQFPVLYSRSSLVIYFIHSINSVCVVFVAKSYLTLFHPVDCSAPGFSVHSWRMIILQVSLSSPPLALSGEHSAWRLSSLLLCPFRAASDYICPFGQKGSCLGSEGPAQQPTPVFLPGESHEQWNLVGCSPWGHKEPDTTEVT